MPVQQLRQSVGVGSNSGSVSTTSLVKQLNRLYDGVPSVSAAQPQAISTYQTVYQKTAQPHPQAAVVGGSVPLLTRSQSSGVPDHGSVVLGGRSQARGVPSATETTVLRSTPSIERSVLGTNSSSAGRPTQFGGGRFAGMGPGLVGLADLVFREAVIARAEERNRSNNPGQYGKYGPDYSDYSSARSKQATADFYKGLSNLINTLKDGAQKLWDKFPRLNPKNSEASKTEWKPGSVYGQAGSSYQIRGVLIEFYQGNVYDQHNQVFNIRAPFTGLIHRKDSYGEIYYFLSSDLYGRLVIENNMASTSDTSGSTTVTGVITAVIPLNNAPPALGDVTPGIEVRPGDFLIGDPGTVPTTGLIPSLQSQITPAVKPLISPSINPFPGLKTSPFPELSPLPDLPELPQKTTDPVPSIETPTQTQPLLSSPSGFAQSVPKITPVKVIANDVSTAIIAAISPPKTPTKTTEDRCEDPCIQKIIDNQDNQDCCDETEISIKVFKACTTVNNAGVVVNAIDFEYKKLKVLVNEAAAYQFLFDRLFALESLQCNPCDAVAAVPDWWQVRTGADRPQLVIVYANILNGKLGRSRWSVIVPHFNSEMKERRDYPSYKKGSYFATLTLSDNSKLTINGESEQIAENTVLELVKFINPIMLSKDVNNLDIHTGKRKGKALSIVNVVPVAIHYFSTGQRDMMPDWIADL